MPENPRLTAKEAEKILLQNGFTIDRQKGSHKIYVKNAHRMVLRTALGEFYTPKS